MGASSSKLKKASAGLGTAAAGVQAIPIFGQIAGAIMGGVAAGLGGAAAARARKEREEAEALAREQLNASDFGIKQGRSAGERIRVAGGPGVGISSVPGPWSAIGTAITQGSGQGQKQGSAWTSTPAATPNVNSIGQGQLQPNQPPRPDPVSDNVFGSQQGAQGGYQSQMQSSIANLILKGDINDLGGV